MSNCAFKLFPRPCGQLRSKPFTVRCGEYAKVTAYDLCPGACIRFSEVHEDACKCEYNERPFCLNKTQVGIDAQCTQAVIPMPGCYVAYVCEDEEGDFEDATIYVDICTHLENVQTVIAAEAVGA